MNRRAEISACGRVKLQFWLREGHRQRLRELMQYHDCTGVKAIEDAIDLAYQRVFGSVDPGRANTLLAGKLERPRGRG